MRLSCWVFSNAIVRSFRMQKENIRQRDITIRIQNRQKVVSDNKEAAMSRLQIKSLVL